MTKQQQQQQQHWQAKEEQGGGAGTGGGDAGWVACWDFDGSTRGGESSYPYWGNNQWSANSWSRHYPPDPSWQSWNVPMMPWPADRWWEALAMSYNLDGSQAEVSEDFAKRMAQWQAQAPPDPNAIYEGSLKSLSDKHGYGFIACEAVYRMFGRDTYLSKELVPPGAKVLSRLTFKVKLSDKGHPQAFDISIAPTSVSAAAAQEAAASAALAASAPSGGEAATAAAKAATATEAAATAAGEEAGEEAAAEADKAAESPEKKASPEEEEKAAAAS